MIKAMGVKAKERIKLVHFLMMPIAYKRLWIIYLVFFINWHHQSSPISFCIPYKPLQTQSNWSIQLQKHLAVSISLFLLMPLLRRSLPQSSLPVQILLTLYINFSMKTFLHQPARVATPSLASESLTGVFPFTFLNPQSPPYALQLSDSQNSKLFLSSISVAVQHPSLISLASAMWFGPSLPTALMLCLVLNLQLRDLGSR